MILNLQAYLQLLHVLVVDNKIAKIAKGIEVAGDVLFIACTGKTLMPDLIDLTSTGIP
jgi:dihydroorotase-like cyclic amidohydrolase